mmetsp:Transcript_497/g.1674  ORF Transcript_497/g.1674 Transcript_497/m.1674 type:complete len:390 (-) Transcript_497:71-1240(-)
MSRPAGGAGCSIFVGNVPYDAQEDELRELFSKVGNVTSVRIVCDKDTRQPKGYAFCDFSDPGSVQSAIEKLNNVEYNGRKLRIDCAERELQAPLNRLAEERPTGRPSVTGSVAGPAVALPMPLPTVADRLARLREQEAAEQARVAAANAAERAEIARLMETLTPRQVLQLLGEMQRLVLRAPEVARALLSENLQLALALQHAEFLVGALEEPPLATEPEVKERARGVREKLWGSTVAPVPGPATGPHPGAPDAAPPAVPTMPVAVVPSPAGAPRPSLLALPPLPTTVVPAVAAASLVPYGAARVSRPVEPRTPYAGVVPQRQLAPDDPRRAAPPAVLDLSTARTQEQRQSILEQLVQLSPAEIDRLPHGTKVQLLEFLQTLPAKNSRSS